MNKKLKKFVLLDFKRTTDSSETHYQDMWKVTEQQDTLKEKEWLTFKVFGIETEDGKKIIHRLGHTLLNEYEKLFGNYWWNTFDPPSILLQLLGKGIWVRASQPPQGG